MERPKDGTKHGNVVVTTNVTGEEMQFYVSGAFCMEGAFCGFNEFNQPVTCDYQYIVSITPQN